jgi:hypothetical protein
MIVEVLGILLFSLIFILGISYASTLDMMGHEVALRQTLALLTGFLFLAPIFFCFIR